jgi:hypothetical protein
VFLNYISVDYCQSSSQIFVVYKTPDISGSEQGPVVGSCEQNNEPLGSIKGREFLDYLSDYWLLEKDFDRWSE